MKNDELTLENMSQIAWYNEWVFKKIADFLKGDILEVGAGIGNFTSMLSKKGNLTVIDINQDYLQKLKQRYQPYVKIGFGDIDKGKYFFGQTTFNAIVCFNVLEHIQDDVGAFKNLYLLLKKGGLLILIVPAHPRLYNNIDKSINHFRRYDPKKMGALLSDFQIVKLENINFIGAVGWWIAGKLFRDSSVTSVKIKLFNLIAPFFLQLENFLGTPFGTSILVIARKL